MATRRLLRTAAAARELGVDPSTLWRWKRTGLVLPVRITPGGHAIWDMDDLDRQLERTSEAALPDPTEPEPQPIVAAIITSDKGLLVTWRHDKTPPAGFLTGEVEPGESAFDAMIRESKEEAGLRISPGPQIGRRVHPRTGRTMIYIAGKPIGETDVHIGDRAELKDIRWVTLEEAEAAFAPFGGMYEPVKQYLTRVLRS